MYGLSVVIYEGTTIVAILTMKGIEGGDNIVDISDKMFWKWCEEVGYETDEAVSRFHTEEMYTIIWDKEDI